jgi:iron complex outermembrane recepter protein
MWQYFFYRINSFPKQNFVWLLLALFSVCQINGQTNIPCTLTLSGNVVDADSKEPLSNATLLISPLNKTVVTDSFGNYTIANLCEGEIAVTVTHMNCGVVTFKLKLKTSLVKNFLLPHNTKTLEMAVVRDKRVYNSTTIKNDLSGTALLQTRGLSLGETLQKVNGVTVLQSGSTIFKPVIHGLHSQRILILNNGVRLEGQQWGSEHAPELDPFAADKITVLKGSGALRYGADAIGGVIMAEPRAIPQNGKTSAEFSTGYFSNNRMYTANAMVEQNLANKPWLSWRLQASTRQAGNTRTPNYWLHNTGLKEYSGTAMLSVKKIKHHAELYASVFNTQLGIFWGSHTGSLTDLNNAINAKEPIFNINKFTRTIDRPKQAVLHVLTKAKYNYYPDARHKFSISISHQENNRQEFDLARITDEAELDLSIGTTNAEISYEHKHNKWIYTYGGNYMLQNNVWSGSRFFIPNFRTHQVSGFWLAKANGVRWDVDFGVRYDYRSLKTFRNALGVQTSQFRNWHNASATAGAVYKLGTSSTVTLNSALAWRPPHVNELFVNGLHHGASAFEIGDANLKPEVAFNNSVQYNYTSKDSSFSFNVNMYANLIDGFINLTPDTPATLTIRGAFPTFRYRQTNALLKGLDVSIAYQLYKGLSINGKAALLYARSTTENTWLAQMPSNRYSIELKYQFPSTPKLADPFVALQATHVARQTRLPVVNTDFLLPPRSYTIAQAEMGGFLRLAKKQLYTSVGVYNLGNLVYREYMNRFRYFNDEMGLNIALRLHYKI